MTPIEQPALRSPRPWLFDLGLPPRALGLCVAIVQWTTNSGECRYSAKALARRLKWNPRTVERAIADLIGKGVIKRRGQGKLGLHVPDRPTSDNAVGSDETQPPTMVSEVSTQPPTMVSEVSTQPPTMVSDTSDNAVGASVHPTVTSEEEKRRKEKRGRGKDPAPEGAPLFAPEVVWSKVSQSVEVTPRGRAFIENELELHTRELKRLDPAGPEHVELSELEYAESFRQLSVHLMVHPYKRGPKSLPGVTLGWLKKDLTDKRARTRSQPKRNEPKGFEALREYERQKQHVVN